MGRSANYLFQDIFESLKELRRLNHSCSTLTGLEDAIRDVGLMEHLFPQWTILGFNIEKSRPDYLSENGKYLFGDSWSDVMSISVNDFFSRIHPDDVEYVMDALNKVHDFFKDHQNDPLAEYRFLTSYRFRKPDGRYIHLCGEKTTYQNQLFMMLFRDISAERPFNHVRLEIFKHTKDGRCCKIEEYVPYQMKVFTSREMEILQLIQQGFSSKEISDQLKISHHTVRNHRSRLFEKTNSKNVIELLNFAKDARVI